VPEARLAITCGLPKSGKTTYARGLQEAWWVRLCPDKIRQALHGRGHYPPAEPLVWANAELTVRALLLIGHAVVVGRVPRAQPGFGRPRAAGGHKPRERAVGTGHGGGGHRPSHRGRRVEPAPSTVEP
jgi:hypothetical protein